MTKMATVNMERYNEDEVGVSVWACPIYGSGRVVWCLCLRLGVFSWPGGGVVGSAEGRRWSFISSEHRQHMCTQQVVHMCVCVCVRVCVHMCSTNATNECRFEAGAHG